MSFKSGQKKKTGGRVGGHYTPFLTRIWSLLFSTGLYRTKHRKLYSEGFRRRVILNRIRIREVNMISRVLWSRINRRTTLDTKWKSVILSDEFKVEIGTDHRVFIWRKVGESYLPFCLGAQPTPRISLMIWGCVTYDGIGTLAVTTGNVNAQQYVY